MDKGKGKKVLDTDDKDLDDYFAQYFDPAHTISAAPAINPSALLGPKEFGPSLPSQAGRTLTLKAQECEGGVPYPAGYTRTVPSVDILPTTSGPSRPGAASSASSYTAAKVEEKKRTSYAVGSSNDPLDKLKYRKATVLRQGGGMTWEDESLLEWDENDFRIFVGDLGNEVSDEMLYKAFIRYNSIQKARIVRDRKSGKSKGYGFVSFKDPQDFLKAMREMNGKYIGHRPVKLSKSSWKERNVDVKSLAQGRLGGANMLKRK